MLIHVAHGADDTLSQHVVVELHTSQELGSAIISVQCLLQVWIAVGQVLEVPAADVEVAKATVCTADDPHLVPQPRRAEKPGCDHGRAVELVVRLLVQVCSLTHVIDLRRHDDALARRAVLGHPEGRRRSAVRQVTEERLDVAIQTWEHVCVCGQVDHASTLEDACLEFTELRLDFRPIFLRELNQLANSLKLTQAGYLFTRPPCNRQLPSQTSCCHHVTGRQELRATCGLRLASELQEAVLVLPGDPCCDLRHEVHQGRHLCFHSFAPHHEVGHGLIRIPLRRDERCRADTPG
mmetsp:Transcript_18406/g.46330  ORF Transcript_18406/g.46330 Transcript_18406/m.46330 type:complete len:294 (-) Transcript_18406:2230-3111(-)